ncbi:hypothetical protein BD309DRAFT_994742 [Dichomitus squalens]|uniref:Uncharacterized protein n=1 Tax=Dichomitus squalens TaxID=114155 RepID=A0A4Q9NAZ4_9APHY|nr:hypothetical protein BD309DRAFT_994742 [Dichomitus squalens]TBU61198.1 hypothetical protein BD310DRAFT_946643 [Dichomitus squalens]
MHLPLPVTLQNMKAWIVTFLSLWLYNWPFALPGGVVLGNYNPMNLGLITRICSWFGHTRDCTHGTGYTRYRSATQEEEEEYWKASQRLGQASQSWDGCGVAKNIPVVRYFTPKLLPIYREKEEDDPEATEVYLHPKAYCKWHRMVFPGPMHPTIREAPEQIKYYSSRDRREIHRISRLLPDSRAFRRELRDKAYAKMWKNWLDTKGPDVAVVFE